MLAQVIIEQVGVVGMLPVWLGLRERAAGGASATGTISVSNSINDDALSVAF
jgi:hypothetical protein